MNRACPIAAQTPQPTITAQTSGAFGHIHTCKATGVTRITPANIE